MVPVIVGVHRELEPPLQLLEDVVDCPSVNHGSVTMRHPARK